MPLSNILSEESPVTIGLAVTTLGVIAVAIKTVFTTKSETLKEADDRFVRKDVLDTKLQAIENKVLTRLDVIEKSIGKVDHMHDCMHRLEGKLDTILERKDRP